MDQNAVEDMLNQLQNDANAVKASASPEDAAAVAATAAQIADLAAAAGGQPGSDQSASPDLTAEDFPPPPQANAGNEVHRLLAIEVPVIVELGKRRMTVGEVMRLAVGAIVEFHKSAEEELELLANNKPIGKGHAVKVGENFGIKISNIGSVKETIKKLGTI